MKILIVKLSAIGDVIHTLPSLNALRNHFQDAEISWLVEEAAANLIEGHEALDHIIVSKRKRWAKNLFTKKCLNTIHDIYYFIKDLRATRYDMVIDFHGLLKSGILIGLAKGERKIGYGKGMNHQEYSYLFLHEHIPAIDDMNTHAILGNMMLLDAIGIPSDKIEYHIPISNQDRIDVKNLLKQHGIKKSSPVVAINPVAKWDTKLWSNKKFAELGDKLIEQYRVEIIFTGSREDQETIHDIMGNMEKRAAGLAGTTSLKTLAALYDHIDFLVSTDTGPMHLAAAVGSPVIALFGPTAPWRTGPFGNGHEVIRADLDCSPCFKRQCKTTECMKQITVDQVLRRVERIKQKQG